MSVTATLSGFRDVFCCGCQRDVQARLTEGSEVYPHRSDLSDVPYWKCDACGNFVGCHHKTSDRTRPLGCIPTPELRAARQQIHKVIDPIWRSGHVDRSRLYSALARVVGVDHYHTAEIRSVEQAHAVCVAAKEMSA